MGLEDQYIQPFDTLDEDDRSKRWEEWIANFDRFIFIKGVKEDNLKINYLLFLGGNGVDKVYQPVKDETDTYDVVKGKLTDQFKSKFSSKIHVLQFRELYQFKGELFENFVTRLKEKAKKCSFADEDNEILVQILHKCTSQKLKRKVLESEKELKLDEIIKAGKLEESVTVQLQEFDKISDTEK
ncbi:unnamed protein product [Brachionus calyciflorus]|uniref:Uncharacterized protein n=1 Tax=Brachionus calyciflorus TaxID=104777 RepID=A0A813R7V1_9BILA|nr:unnamed protein product [Brachionus calyciflorus]